MSEGSGRRGRPSEGRLDRLREEAGRRGRLDATGARAVGGPLPRGGAVGRGYHGMPVLKPPVWTWEVPVYFFVGGLAGMAALLALAAAMTGPYTALAGGGPRADLVRASLTVACLGAAASTVLLVLDLGRPRRFLHMLRVFKLRSPMSVGAWTLAAFGAAAAAALLLTLVAGGPDGGRAWGIGDGGAAPVGLVGAAALAAVAAAGLLGGLLATYTGVLLAATAIPVWHRHRRLLPLHFGVAGLGSAAALLELLGFRLASLHVLGLLAAGAETAVALAIELRGGSTDGRALREGRAGHLIRISGLLAGPTALLLRLVGWVPGAAVAFLLGSLLARFGWLAAGRASARDPEAVLGEAVRGHSDGVAARPGDR